MPHFYTSPLALALGLAANVAAHAYQGRQALWFHVPFYLLACAIVFSPLGLIGAIGMHFAGDLLPFLMFKNELRDYRQHHRERRASGVASQRKRGEFAL